MTTGSAKREAPPVNPADFLAVWELIRQARTQSPAENQFSTTVHCRALQQTCTPGANVEAVAARTLMLDILSQVRPRWMEQPNAGKILELAARFPLTLPQLGVESDEPPFDLREFMKQVALL
jgi:hypothetical protein